MRLVLVFAVLMAASGAAVAQSSDSTTCRLFPLACPGPTPTKPEPLYGTPEEQAAAQPVAPMTKHKGHVRKKVAKGKSQ